MVRWLDYDPISTAVLMFGLAAVVSFALSLWRHARSWVPMASMARARVQTCTVTWSPVDLDARIEQARPSSSKGFQELKRQPLRYCRHDGGPLRAECERLVPGFAARPRRWAAELAGRVRSLIDGLFDTCRTELHDMRGPMW